MGKYSETNIMDGVKVLELLTKIEDHVYIKIDDEKVGVNVMGLFIVYVYGLQQFKLQNVWDNLEDIYLELEKIKYGTGKADTQVSLVVKKYSNINKNQIDLVR